MLPGMEGVDARTTALVSAAAILVATVLGGALSIVGGVVAERIRHRASRREHLLTVRLEVYADLLEVAARVTENVRIWASLPEADLEEHDDAFLNRMLARVRAHASDDVRELALAWKGRVEDFHRERYRARLALARAHESGAADTQEAIQARMVLAGIADEIRAGFDRLEAAVRRDTGAQVGARAFED